MTDHDRILLPTDGSEAGEAAVDEALSLAEAFDAELHVLSVVDATAFPETPTEAVVDAFESAAEEAVEEVAERANEAGVDVETAVGHGTPYRAIDEYVTDNDVDMVVMGTHGRTGLERYLMGSVTEKAVRTIEVPVVTVHPEQ